MSPVPTFTGLGPNPQFEDVTRKINTLVMELRNLMLSLDTLNVVELDADVIIAGTVTAEKMNVTELSAISANMGTITAGTIIGALIKTALSGQRIQMDSTEFASYDAAGKKRISLSPNTVTYELAGLEFIDDGSPQVVKGHIFSNSTQMGIIGQAALSIRSLTGTMTLSGTVGFTDIVNFGTSTVTGLENNAVPDHNHGLNSTDYLQCYDSGGTPTVKKQWVPSGGHNHTIT